MMYDQAFNYRKGWEQRMGEDMKDMDEHGGHCLFMQGNQQVFCKACSTSSIYSPLFCSPKLCPPATYTHFPFAPNAVQWLVIDEQVTHSMRQRWCLMIGPTASQEGRETILLEIFHTKLYKAVLQFFFFFYYCGHSFFTFYQKSLALKESKMDVKGQMK